MAYCFIYHHQSQQHQCKLAPCRVQNQLQQKRRKKKPPIHEQLQKCCRVTAYSWRLLHWVCFTQLNDLLPYCRSNMKKKTYKNALNCSKLKAEKMSCLRSPSVVLQRLLSLRPSPSRLRCLLKNIPPKWKQATLPALLSHKAYAVSQVQTRDRQKKRRANGLIIQ